MVPSVSLVIGVSYDSIRLLECRAFSDILITNGNQVIPVLWELKNEYVFFFFVILMTVFFYKTLLIITIL